MAWNDFFKLFWRTNKHNGPLVGYNPAFDEEANAKAVVVKSYSDLVTEDMRKNPLKYGVPIPGTFTAGVNLSAPAHHISRPITYGKENIPGPHPPPMPPQKFKPRSLYDDWEVTQDT